jgi:hypothetical protein
MRGAVAEQDYWPGFLDILVNVMLYLLLLVGSFALGAVALTLHSMQQRQQLNFLDIDKALAVDALGLGEEDRQRLMMRLEALDVEAMVRRREALDRERQLVESRRLAVERELALRQAQTQRQAPAPGQNPSNDERLFAQVRQQTSDHELRLTALSDQLRSTQGSLVLAKETLAQNVQNRGSVAAQGVSEFRVAPVREQGNSTSQLALLVIDQLERSPVAVWEFSADELIWPGAKVPPISGMTLSSEADWTLVIFADTNNVRVVRESFARVNSVRETLIGRGFDRERIKAEVRSNGPLTSADERLFRSVFMLPNN